MTVEGRTLKSKVSITAEVNGRTAVTAVKVMDKSTEDKTIPLRIELKDKDFGNFRAQWDEARPHVLLISARHPSLERYLGSESEEFPGQNSPHFRLLLAEIVAESVCRKVLIMEAKQRPYDFNFTASPEPAAIADLVFFYLHKKMREFVSEAML